MTRVEEVDRRLTATTNAFHDAIDRGDLEAADVLYAELDDLLDQRLHLPLQREQAD
jgi:iron uptake system EfeUOB component EfeO/EfeM